MTSHKSSGRDSVVPAGILKICREHISQRYFWNLQSEQPGVRKNKTDRVERRDMDLAPCGSGHRRLAANLIIAFTMLVVHVGPTAFRNWEGSGKSLVVVIDMTERYHCETWK